MKVLGVMENGDVMFVASKHETAELTGLCARAGHILNLNALPKAGQEFAIGAAWRRVEELKRLPETLLELRALANRIGEAIDTLAPPISAVLEERTCDELIDPDKPDRCGLRADHNGPHEA